MKNKIGFVAIFAFLSLAMAETVGDISGKWYAPMEGVYVEMVFEVDGTTLNGTMYNPLSGKEKIKDGRIEGANISFYVERKFRQRDVRVAWQGLITGNEIEFNRVIGGGGGLRVIAQREKEGLPAEKGQPAAKKKGNIAI